MILDDLEHSSRYEAMHPLFAKAFNFIKSGDFLHGDPGKHVVIEDELIVMVNDAVLKSPDKARMEIHDKYIDIHVPISAAEAFAWKRRSLLSQEAEPFNAEKDAQHYLDEPETRFEVPQGCFAIFFPEDAHVGCVGEGILRKIVVKVKVNSL